MSQRPPCTSPRAPKPTRRPASPSVPAARAVKTRDQRIDAYIARSAPFARPILTHVRAIIHAGCPSVRETIKWGRPFFEHHGILCMMAAFQHHCHFALWRSLVEQGRKEDHLRRITAISDLPPRSALLAQVRAAAAANATAGGARAVRRVRAARPAASIPEDLLAALERTPAAGRIFTAFTPAKQREYIDWLNEAKRDATRASRLAQALEWINAGKSRHWKYLPA